MINEKELKARMAGSLEAIKREIPALCESLGAREKDVAVATVSAFKTIEGIVDDLAEKGGWIPCSERLPEEDGGYLCFWGTGVMQVFKFSNDLYAVDDYDFYEYEGKNKKKGFYGYDSECGYYEIDYITAWMPLPEPYIERNEE